ncbi:16S rRNA (cytosine(967)-C(5))-methyltransferase [Synechococcus sp. CBW1002]|nr:16S rRNA (cytosine(967)-C(5))-methyltransferase [Synechococcus sp. CBW1002]
MPRGGCRCGAISGRLRNRRLADPRTDVAAAGRPAADPGIGLAPRQVAWQVLQAVAAGAYADVALERELARRPLQGSDRGLATELSYGAIRQRRLLDAWIDRLGRVPALRQPPKLRWLLHLGLYQLLFSQRIPASATVSTTVELAKRAQLGRLAPVVNGMLRALLRSRSREAQEPQPPVPWSGLSLPADPAQAWGVRHSLPDWLAELIPSWLTPEAAEAFGQACNTPPHLDIRVNPLRSSPEALRERLAAAAVTAQPLAGFPEALCLGGHPGDLRQLPGYTEGWWCVQDRQAQQVVPLLAPLPGERILDACAAPGGKSIQIAERQNDTGEIWAVDRSEGRLQRLVHSAQRLGLGSIHTLAADALSLAAARPDWIGSFDRLLVDAPCSGLGTLARHADARWRMSPAAIDELVELQRQLLEALLPLLKPGGRLVYATCTVHPSENSEQIASLSQRHPELVLIEQWQRWPSAMGGDGFYAAALTTAA